jgi:hypothetical protein
MGEAIQAAGANAAAAALAYQPAAEPSPAAACGGRTRWATWPTPRATPIGWRTLRAPHRADARLIPVEKFGINLQRDPAPTAVEVWGERLLGVLRALQDHAGVERVMYWESREEVHEIPVERAAVTAYLRSRPVSVDDAGVPQPKAGVVTSVYGVGPGGIDDDLCEVMLSTGERELVRNWCIVSFRRPVSPEAMPELFSDCVAAVSPIWGALESRANITERLDEEEETGAPKRPAREKLHWHTYFGPDGAAGLDLESLRGRDDVIIRPLHEGVEVVLGERWESNAALRAKQREVEPLLFGERAAS